jgi:hypothetical protein
MQVSKALVLLACTRFSGAAVFTRLFTLQRTKWSLTITPEGGGILFSCKVAGKE